MPRHQKNIQEIIWKGIYYQTLEYCRITSHSGYTIDGIIVGMIEKEPLSLRYRVVLDAQFRTQHLSVFRRGKRLNLFELRRSASGWHDYQGKHLPEFDACIDIDIVLTPSTNTLPIRRLSFIPQVAQEIHVLYINPVTQSRQVNVQVYTQLNPELFRYQNPDSGFTALLPVDAFGIVGDYGNIWKRLYPAPGLPNGAPVGASDRFTKALAATPSNAAVSSPKLLYQPLLGDWEVTVVEADAGARKDAVEQWYFSAIREDQAIQEVIRFPAFPAPGTSHSPDQPYETTIRSYDAGKKQWTIHGFAPAKWHTNTVVGYGSADQIIEEGRDENGDHVRQRFFDIGTDSFQSIRERSPDGGITWFTAAEFFARRK